MEKMRKKIILVDDIQTNLTIGKESLKAEYEVYPLRSAAKMFEFLDKITPDLILLDVDMPEMDGFTAIKILKANSRYAAIPVIFLTAKAETNDELEGLTLGAIDYVTKPFLPPLLLQRVKNHLLIESQKAELKGFKENLSKMVQKQTQKIFDLQQSVIATVAELVEFRDDVTGWHTVRTQKFLQLIVEEIIFSGMYRDEALAWDMDFLSPSALMHDVGKIAIPDSILNKPGKLTADEFEIMKTHAQKGVEIIERMYHNCGDHNFLKHSKTIAGSHHEKWDGSGYPYGLAGTDIPLEGRIMAIADVYDALIATRPYKKALSTSDAAKIIIDSAETHFDPTLVAIFTKLQDSFAEIAKNYAAA